MTPEYAAGLIDGEGYIGIQEAGGTFQVRLKVSMTDKGLPALRAMRRMYGGKVLKDRDARDRCREAWTWRLTGETAAHVIQEVRPLMLVKAESADVALEFQAMLESAERRSSRSRVWTQEMHDRARMLRARIQEANRRGPDPEPPILPPGKTPLAVYRWGWWWEPNDDLMGPVEFKGKIPSTGRMVAGHLYETEPPATGSSSSRLLPTPRTSDTNGAGAHGQGGPDLRTAVTLLPTPRASDGTNGGPNQRGSSGDLMLPSAVHRMLPTPTATPYGSNQSPSPGAAVRPSLDGTVRLLPTPTAMDSRASGGSTPANVTLTDADVRARLGTTPNPRHGDRTPPPSTDGRQPWDVPLPLPPS